MKSYILTDNIPIKKKKNIIYFGKQFFYKEENYWRLHFVMNSIQPCRSGSSRSHFKRSQSQNARMDSNCSKLIQKSTERLRKTKSLGDLKRSVTGYWNWQLETGSWSEVTLDQPIELGIKRTGNQEQVAENYIINFIPASSSSIDSSFGKQSFTIQ